MPQFLDHDGQTLHVSYIPGAPHRRAVVFSNSLGTDLRIWDAVLTLLPEGTPTLRIDKRGHGLSALGPVSFAALAEDTAFAMDHFGFASAVICGVSVGGAIAQTLSVARPDLVSALVLTNTALRFGTPEMWNPRIETARRDGLEPLADAVMQRWFSPEFHDSNAVDVAGYRTMLTRCDAEGYARVCEVVRDGDLTEVASQVAVPTTCVAGSVDGATPPAVVQELAEAVPGATYEEIVGVGHLPCIEAPDRIAAAVGGYL